MDREKHFQERVKLMLPFLMEVNKEPLLIKYDKKLITNKTTKYYNKNVKQSKRIKYNVSIIN